MPCEHVFVLKEIDPNRKGNIAEAVIAAEAVKLGIEVFRPVTEHGRVDLVFGLHARLWRVQCKWGALSGDGAVIRVSSGTSRRGAAGYVRSTYGIAESDLLAVHCGEIDRSYLLPMELCAGRSVVILRLAPARNGQQACITLACDYEFRGAVAQLEERCHGMAEVTGSSPVSSTPPGSEHIGAAAFGAHPARYLQRARGGESFLVTRRGRPMARVSPPPG